jgi:hypothetical protein
LSEGAPVAGAPLFSLDSAENQAAISKASSCTTLLMRLFEDLEKELFLHSH